MTGRQDLFDESMRLGHSAAWELNWDLAIEYYRKALAEFPENADALSSLGLALFETERFKEAIQVYYHASQLAPNDPIPVEKTAEILEKMGRQEDAITQRQAAAELYLKRRDAEKAIDNWSNIARMTPQDLGIRSRLAVTFERLGRQKQAVYEYLAVASILQAAGKNDRAIEAAQRALRIIPGEKEAARALRLLQQGKPLPPPSEPRAITSPLKAEEVREYLKTEAQEAAEAGVEEQSDPEIAAQSQALTILAGLLFEESEGEGEGDERPLDMAQLTEGRLSQERKSIGQPQMLRYLGQAIDLQTRGNDRQAVREYERAIKAGLDHPAAHYNLGILLKSLEDYEEAAKHLTQALGHPDLDLGANLALGRMARLSGDMPEAARFLLQALRRADTYSVDEGQSSQLNQLYETILASQDEDDEESLSQIVENTLNFLSGPEWLERLRQARRQLEGQAGSATLIPIAEMLAVGGTEKVIQAIARIDELVSKKLFNAAMEEALLAIDHVPTYLALHQRIAEIMIAQGNLQAGIEKLRTIAKTHQVRGEIQQAANVFSRIVEFSPIDVETRRQVIDLLAQQDRNDEAMAQYMDLIELYRQMAEIDQARQTLDDALRLSQRGGVDAKWPARVLRLMGDIDLSRLEWRKALRDYEQLLKIDPEDETARTHVIDLNLRLGLEEEAAEALDVHLDLLVHDGHAQEALQMLEDLAREYPGKQVLHIRLADAYRAAGRTADAIAQYDALGEIQLDAGQIPQAIHTIETILDMNPPNIEGYQELLRNLKDEK